RAQNPSHLVSWTASVSPKKSPHQCGAEAGQTSGRDGKAWITGKHSAAKRPRIRQDSGSPSIHPGHAHLAPPCAEDAPVLVFLPHEKRVV
ncbi:hypothetical protein P7K49_015006, partial [Saguinus oedipus]